MAEPRRRQKKSVNPRGTDWVNDESKFGQKLMEGMGLSKGKGLGANEDGRQESVKVKFKDDNKGVGCTKNHADNWIAHQDNFNNLLANLNNDIEVKKEETVTVSSLEAKSKSSRKRVHYQKFTKGKDLSTRSVEDLNCIFGIKDVKVKMECKKSPKDTSECGTETNENNHGLISVTSSSSVQDYVAEKMAAKLKKEKNSMNLTKSNKNNNVVSRQPNRRNPPTKLDKIVSKRGSVAPQKNSMNLTKSNKNNNVVSKHSRSFERRGRRKIGQMKKKESETVKSFSKLGSVEAELIAKFECEHLLKIPGYGCSFGAFSQKKLGMF